MRNWTALLGAWLSIAACDGGSGGAAGGGERTIRGDGAREDGTAAGNNGDGSSGSSLDAKPASTLSAAETSQFCEWLVELAETPFTDEQYCTQAASESTDDSEECEELRDECMADFDEGAVAPDCGDAAFPEGCTATIGEFKSCLRGLLEVASAAIERSTCDDPEAGRTSDELPSACEDVPEECFEFGETF
jgi:hypothetical protein